MTYIASVSLETATPIHRSDPDVRSISRIPGFIRLERSEDHAGRYTLVFEVEAGSRRDAADATDELLVEYENALSAYQPRLLATASRETR